MMLRVPFSIGVLVASFGTVGCSVSNAEVPDRGWWDSGTAIDAGATPDGGVAADGGSDGSIYGNDGGTQHHAGSGGNAHQGGNAGNGGSEELPYDAGGGGTGGEEEPVAGNGGTGGEEEPVAGSGGTGGEEAPVGGSGGSGAETCPSEYTLATHISMNVTWPKKSILGVEVIAAGSGVVHVWTKSNFDEDGNNATVLSRSCGSKLPVISALGGEKILPEIPDATWDKSSMPQFSGTATKTGNTVNASPGVALVGLTMTNPTGTWPARTSIMGVDHDSDGKLGLAAIPRSDSPYARIPLDISKSKRADRVDLAIRNIMTLSATVSGCPETYNGTANVTKFDNHVIGCHVYGGGECTDTQKKFVDDNSVVYTVGSATYKAKRVSASASCADVRGAVP